MKPTKHYSEIMTTTLPKKFTVTNELCSIVMQRIGYISFSDTIDVKCIMPVAVLVTNATIIITRLDGQSYLINLWQSISKFTKQ